MFKYLKDNHLILIQILLLLVVVIASALFVSKHTNDDSLITPPIVSTDNTSVKDLKEFFPMETNSTLKDIGNQIDEAHSNIAPDYKYYTYSQKAADAIAEEYGKEQKADKIIKTTTEVPISEPQKKPDTATSTDNTTNASNNTQKPNDTVIENNYYAISLERKHRISLGAAHIDSENYITTSYRNRDVEYTVFGAPENKTLGVGVSVTVAKW